MKATSPAAKISPMATEAIIATLTSMPARIVPVAKNRRKAYWMIGRPQSRTGIHAQSQTSGDAAAWAAWS